MIRDLIVSLFLIALMPASFRKPFVGLLVFSLLAYMRVQDLTWGFARNIRWSFYIALITFAGFFVSTRERRFTVQELRITVMAAMVCLVAVSIVKNRGIDSRDLSGFLEYGKIIVIAMFTTGLVHTRERLRMLLWVITLSFAFFGAKSGLVGVVTLGRMEILQGPGGMMMDNNDFALALAMSVPMMVMVGLSEKRQLLRKALLVCVPLTAITIGLTHSRGGFLALSTGTMIMIMRSRKRVMGFSLMLLVLRGGALLGPSGVVNRVQSIGEYEEDSSAQARFAAWRTAAVMIRANPVFGVGFGHFQDNYKRYDPANLDQTLKKSKSHVAHNSYLQIWAECGTPTFMLYLFMMLLCFLDLWDVRRMAMRRYYASWILNYCTMFEASLATFILGSVFLNRAHFDLLYHWVAIIVAFGIIARQHMTDPSLAPIEHQGRGVLQPMATTGFARSNQARGFERRPSQNGAF
ncbi:MAG: putative inorganic carbon (HCO3(-)) transporter [Candidatus Paceibacteria bacterium]|jgi:putative inorganic carbon (HCO3(-)) transporter